jgi:2-dehydro-3-deoxy-D-pentonate aldolase
MKDSNPHFQPRGVVVPMVTPVTNSGDLDEEAVDRLVDFLLAGGVDGIFVLGTTGEGVSVPLSFRRQLVKRTAARARGRARIYAGIGDAHPDEITAGNDFLKAGVDALVSRPPVSFPEKQLLSWYQSLLGGLRGPLILYNMPSTTKVSIPLDVVGALAEHPQVVGIKDSENNPKRLEELLCRMGGRPEFAVFVGVGALMAKGLKLGANGIVPSVGNLIPDVCRKLVAAARRADWDETENHFQRMSAVAALYQRGRNLSESLAALKAAVHCRGLCAPYVLPPLRRLPPHELETLRLEMRRLNLLNGAA